MSVERKRLDELLLSKGMATSRNAARGLIMAGLVLVDGKIPVACLSRSEILLLEFMCKKGGDTTTTSEVAEIVYGTGKVSRMIVASFIDGLRAKIEPSPSNPRFLVAIPGTGYRLRTRGGQLVLRPG